MRSAAPTLHGYWRSGTSYRVRLALARDPLAAGDPAGAATELAAARLKADRIGARALAAEAEALAAGFPKDQARISAR